MSTYIARTVVQGRKHLTKNLKLLRKLRLVLKVAIAERTDQEGSHLRLHDSKTYRVVDFEEHVISRATIHADCTTTQGYSYQFRPRTALQQHLLKQKCSVEANVMETDTRRRKKEETEIYETR
jgi:hypothetical protein